MLVIKDFATTTIASALTAAATSIVVSDASRLPALSAGDHFDLVLQKFTDRNYVEVIRVTGVSGNTLTVARGRDGTMGRAFSIGDYAEVRLTVGVFSTYVSQLVEGKVDKDFSYVNQRLQVVNTGDLVGASLALLYAAGTGHGTIVSGGEGVNKQTPYIALRPLGHANATTQLKYTDEGALSLVGGTRSASFGFILSEHSFDSNGFPNAVDNDANNYVNRARSKITAGNSGLHFLADAALDARLFGIQSGHSSAANATSYGVLDLNPFGGLVRVNGGSVYHTGYVPTPAAVGALALSGGTLTGILSQNMSGYGVRFLASGGSVYLQGGKVDSSADQKMVLSGFNGVPLTNFNILTATHGLATINGARLYTEQYLPTPDVLGCVPSARTINSKPLSANIALTAAEVGAAPVGFGLGTYGTGISTVLGDCNLRRQSGFFQGSNIAGIPNTEWTYLFNQAHGNAAGYFGYLAINFAGTQAWIGGQEGGAQKGPFELVKQGDRFVANNAVGNEYHQCAIEVNGNTAIDSRPGIGFHMTGRFAGTLHLWEGGDFRFHTQGLGSYAGIMAGNVNANDVYIRSDRRLKKNLVEVRDALRKVSSLTAYSYDKKQTLEATEYDKKEVGLIAQDVEQVLPEAVTRVVDSSNKDGTEILTLSNSALIALLVGAVKELSEKVKELEYGRT